MKNQLWALVLLFASGLFSYTKAQDDLMKLLEEESASEPVTEFTQATFKTTRLINGHTVEQTAAGVLDFKINHRFGTINKGIYELWGLDNATMLMAFDYGVSKNLMVGVGRATFEKTYTGYFKYRLMHQSTGKKKNPLSINWYSSMMVNSLRWANPERENYFSSRLYYAHQLIVGRKFNESISFQLMPTVVHHNLVQGANDPNDIFALGAGGRVKLNKRISVNAEYFYQIPGLKLPGTTNTFSLGFDVETGGHVFQLHVTNSRGMTENTFISRNTGSWENGDILFGFNISRVFTVRDNRKINRKN
jgi:hypothetical protein